MGYFVDNFDIIYEQVLNEKGWGVDADSTTLKQEMKAYNKFVSVSRTKTEKIEELDERIEILEKCSKQMKDTLSNKNGKNKSEAAKYAFKKLIPFNDIARFISKHDVYAGHNILVNIFLMPLGLSTIGPLNRYYNFDLMIRDSIKNTDEAIAYLKAERAKLK